MNQKLVGLQIESQETGSSSFLKIALGSYESEVALGSSPYQDGASGYFHRLKKSIVIGNQEEEHLLLPILFHEFAHAIQMHAGTHAASKAYFEALQTSDQLMPSSCNMYNHTELEAELFRFLWDYASGEEMAWLKNHDFPLLGIWVRDCFSYWGAEVLPPFWQNWKKEEEYGCWPDINDWPRLTPWRWEKR